MTVLTHDYWSAVQASSQWTNETNVLQLSGVATSDTITTTSDLLLLNLWDSRSSLPAEAVVTYLEFKVRGRELNSASTLWQSINPGIGGTTKTHGTALTTTNTIYTWGGNLTYWNMTNAEVHLAIGSAGYGPYYRITSNTGSPGQAEITYITTEVTYNLGAEGGILLAK